MGWLRTQRDIIGLIAIWGLLLQGLAIPFASGLHAAALTADDDFALICASPGTPAPDQTPRNGLDCQCTMACHGACGGACGGGLLPTFARIVLPGERHARAVSSPRASRVDTPLAHETHARAPPFSSS